ncbi:MAG: NAD(+) synthase [Christensenellaceae bacterium]
MKQRMILNDISPDFKRDFQTQTVYIEQKKEACESYIKKMLTSSGAKGIVLGISGGIDSFLVGALCANACRDKAKRLLLVILPNKHQSDYDDAVACCMRLKEIYAACEIQTISIENGYEGIRKDLSASAAFLGDAYALGNLAPRLRMTVQYALARKMLVAGTDHACESITGFYTKYGDGGVDFNPIEELVKDDIYEMSALFYAPQNVMHKKPAAGLGITDTDEQELGMKYADICAYLKGHTIADQQKLEQKYEQSKHKRAVPASPKDDYYVPPQRTVVVVDLIHAFVDGTLACENAAKAVKHTISYINSQPMQPVLYVADAHPKEHCSFEQNGGIWKEHAICGTHDAQMMESLYTDIIKTTNTPIAHYNVFQKGMQTDKEQYSGFEAKNEFYGLLKDNLTKEVVVCGAAAEYCILNTVRQLKKAGHIVLVPPECLAYVTSQGYEQALIEMKKAGVLFI